MEKSKLKWEDLEKNARYEPLEEELEETRKQKRSKIKMEKQENKNIEKIINLQEINRKNKEEQEKIRLKTEIANLKKQEKKKQENNKKQEKIKQQRQKQKNKKIQKQEKLKNPEIIKKRNKNKKTIKLISIVFAIIIAIFSIIFAITNINNANITKGVKIEGIDVSGLTREQAKEKLESIYSEKKKKDITLKYEDFETTIAPETLETNYNIEKATNEAILVGKSGNIITNNYGIFFALIGKKNIKVETTINEEQTKQAIEDIQTNLPETIEEPDYYIENDKLIITPGKEGLKILTDKLLTEIKEQQKNINTNQETIEIPAEKAWPSKVDIDKIHQDIYKKVQDAYITKAPVEVHPEVIGIDFNIEDAKKILEENKKQYEIPLQITNPQVTLSNLGSEAFPEKISAYSTRYDGGDKDRSTNLEIACKKIDEKIVLPGETFSYNKTLGARTTKAGYKTAKVYENGAVVDGIGGGICQISSTLYNAVLKANMQTVERRNHQFITSYVPEGRDATVAYGVTDFKFKNTRKYAIKIKATASNGVATISIYGIKENTEYNITFETKTISTIPVTEKYIEDNTIAEGIEEIKQKGANGCVTETYIIKSLNGQVVSKDLLSKDTYSAMQRIILKGTKKN